MKEYLPLRCGGGVREKEMSGTKEESFKVERHQGVCWRAESTSAGTWYADFWFEAVPKCCGRRTTIAPSCRLSIREMGRAVGVKMRTDAFHHTDEASAAIAIFIDICTSAVT